MTKFPLKFSVHATASGKISDHWTSSENHLPPIICSIPPDFRGSGGGYSPEGLFGLSILNCIIATIKYTFDKNKVGFEKIEGSLIATMDRNSAKEHLLISHVEVTLQIYDSKETEEKVHNLTETALKDCPISNSIVAGKTYHISIHSSKNDKA